jgi:ribose transport system substrate-binding protein
MKLKMTTIAIGLALVAGLTACSTNQSADSSNGAADSPNGTQAGIAAAQAYLNTVTTVPTKIELPPLAKKPEPGKKIIALTNGGVSNIDTDQGMREGAKLLGWQFQELSTGTTPESMQAAMQQAVELKPDGITYSGIPTAVLAKQLAAAKQAGIPVVAPALSDKATGPIVDASIASATESTTLSKTLAAQVVVTSKGNAHILLVELPDYPILVTEGNAFKAWITKWCPACSVTESDQQLADIGTKTPANIVSDLQRNPSINWIIYTFGDISTGVQPALQAAGLAKQVVSGGSGPTAANYQGIRAGTDKAWVDYPDMVSGMRVIDSFARYFEGYDMAQLQNYPLGYALATPQTIGQLHFSSDGRLYMPSDALAQFAKIWRVS